jgi:hypothetical protein
MNTNKTPQSKTLAETDEDTMSPEDATILVKALLKLKDAVDEQRKRNDLQKLLYFHRNETKESWEARIAQAVEIYDEFAPRGAAETLLVKHMIGVHFAAQECFCDASIPQQTMAGRKMLLQYAGKMSELFLKQLTTYDRRRGRATKR